MKTSTFLRMICGTTLLAASGCSAHVFSPPANIAPMESVAVTPTDETRLAGFVTSQKLDFGPHTTTLSARVKQGLGHNFEAGLDANFTAFDTSQAKNEDLAGQVGSARINGKWSPIGNYFALTAGFGAGTHTGGQFIAPDLGIVLAYENQYLIPYANVSAFLSQPLNAKPVDISYSDDDSAKPLIQTPDTTWGATWTLGVKLPLTNVAGLPFAPYFGLTGVALWDDTKNTRVAGFSGGIDVTF